MFFGRPRTQLNLFQPRRVMDHGSRPRGERENAAGVGESTQNTRIMLEAMQQSTFSAASQSGGWPGQTAPMHVCGSASWPHGTMASACGPTRSSTFDRPPYRHQGYHSRRIGCQGNRRAGLSTTSRHSSVHCPDVDECIAAAYCDDIGQISVAPQGHRYPSLNGLLPHL